MTEPSLSDLIAEQEAEISQLKVANFRLRNLMTTLNETIKESEYVIRAFTRMPWYRRAWVAIKYGAYKPQPKTRR